MVERIVCEVHLRPPDGERDLARIVDLLVTAGLPVRYVGRTPFGKDGRIASDRPRVLTLAADRHTPAPPVAGISPA